MHCFIVDCLTLVDEFFFHLEKKIGEINMQYSIEIIVEVFTQNLIEDIVWLIVFMIFQQPNIHLVA